MAIEIPMPKLGLTMEEALIIEWLVDDDATVEADQPILLIETDKTETEVGAPGSGRLHQIGEPGDVFPCGQLIGLLLAEGETPPEPEPTAAPAPRDCAGKCRCPVSGRAGTGCRDCSGDPGGRTAVRLAERASDRRRTRRRAAHGAGHGSGRSHRLGRRRRRPGRHRPRRRRAPPGSRWRRSPRARSPTCSASTSRRARRPGGTPRHPRRCGRARSPAPRTTRPHPRHPPEPIAPTPAAAAPPSPSSPAPAGAHRDDPDVGDAGDDRQAHARLVAGDGAADADDGCRHGSRARRPRRPQGRCRRSGAVDHRLRGGRRRACAHRAPPDERPGHRFGDRRPARRSMSGWRSPSTTD